MALDLVGYIVQKGGTARRDCPVLGGIAQRANCSPLTLYQIIRGHKRPGPNLARDLELATDGDWSMLSLRSDLFAGVASVNGGIAS